MQCDLLDKAADRVMKGWCKEWRHRNGRVCALGAFEDVASTEGRNAEHHPTTQPLVFLLASLLPESYDIDSKPYPTPTNISAWRAAWRIANWNNAPDRTKEQVAAKMREAAEVCRIQQSEVITTS